MSFIEKLEPLTNIHDYISQLWVSSRVQQFLASSIFIIFIFTLIGIELNREGLLPTELAMIFSKNHFQAINLAFTLILTLEVISLILSISFSLSRALGKQFEIIALILLRDAFKELSYLPEPVSIANNLEPLLRIGWSASAALIIFMCLGIYNSICSKHKYIKTPEQRMHYVISKKVIALFLFCIFVIIALRDAYLFLFFRQEESFFETIYTVLIFADVAMVLVAQLFMPSFYAVFRNSGFVIATLIMRLSLTAVPPWNSVACIFAALYVLALIWVTNLFAPPNIGPKKKECAGEICASALTKKIAKGKIRAVKSRLSKLFRQKKK